jgi:hypothetical protein
MGLRYNSAMIRQFLKSPWLILGGICPLHGEPLADCQVCAAVREYGRARRRSLWD